MNHLTRLRLLRKLRLSQENGISAPTSSIGYLLSCVYPTVGVPKPCLWVTLTTKSYSMISWESLADYKFYDSLGNVSWLDTSPGCNNFQPLTTIPVCILKYTKCGPMCGCRENGWCCCLLDFATHLMRCGLHCFLRFGLRVLTIRDWVWRSISRRMKVNPWRLCDLILRSIITSYLPPTDMRSSSEAGMGCHVRLGPGIHDNNWGDTSTHLWPIQRQLKEISIQSIYCPNFMPTHL